MNQLRHPKGKSENTETEYLKNIRKNRTLNLKKKMIFYRTKV